MATYLVDSYVLRYDLDKELPRILLHYIDKGVRKSVNWIPPLENLLYLTDLLRNEKPVYYIESTNGNKWITTSREETGEEES